MGFPAVLVPSWQRRGARGCFFGGLMCGCRPPRRGTGGTRTTATSCAPWRWATSGSAPSTSRCASPTSSGSGTSTTAWTWTCRWVPPRDPPSCPRGRRSPLRPPPAQDILSHVTKKEFGVLLAVDQLTLEREKNKVFLQFRECRGHAGGTQGPAVLVPPPARGGACTALCEMPKTWGMSVCTVNPPGQRLHGSTKLWGQLEVPSPCPLCVSIPRRG